MNAEIEKKWQRIWKEKRAFEPEPSGKKFFITVPYPYSNGPLHIGHGRAYTIGDIIARYKRMKGYNVLFPMAFHVTGTPILAIADSIKKGNVDTINLYRDYLSLYENDEKKIDEIIKSFEKPENIALYFAEKIQKDFESLGYSIDWRKKFHTAEKFYNKFVEWQYKKLNEMGYLKKGDYPITFSIADGNPVGEDDIKDGDVDKVSVVEFTAVKFKFEDGFIITGTLRPETIFGVTNIWVKKDGKYAKVRIGNNFYYLSMEAYEKISYQVENVEFISQYEGSYFLGKFVEEPINNRKIPILPANFVDTDNATGFVKSVPAHAPYDYMALKDLGSDIKPIPVIKLEKFGEIPAKEMCEKYNIRDQMDERLKDLTEELYREEFYHGIMLPISGEFSGMKVSEAKEKIKDFLYKTEKAIRFYETSRKAVTRSGNKVIVAVVHGQWFLDYSNNEWKNKTFELIDKMKFYPENYRQIFREIAEWLKERPCVRKRGLGTPFPFEKGWIIESLSDSTIYPAFYTIIDKIREMKIDPEEMDESFFDYIFLGKGEKEKYRELREAFSYWYPNDMRTSSTAHVSNHFIFYLFHHAALFPEKYHPRELMIIGMLISEGAKMSKSKGNVVPLARIAEKYTADLFRLYIISAADYDTILDWRESEVQNLRKKFERFEEIINQSIGMEKIKDLKKSDLYLINIFRERLSKASEFMEKYRFRDAVIEIFFNFLNDIKYYENIEGEERRKGVIPYIMEEWLKAMAPFTPHACEELWHRMGKDTLISLEKYPENINYDENIIREFRYVDNVIDDIKNIIQVKKTKPQEIYIYTADDRTKYLAKLAVENKNLAFREAKNKDELNIVKKIVENRSMEIQDLDEKRILQEFKDHMERVLDAKIKIDPDEDPGKKRMQAIPGRPSIFIL